MKKLMVALLLLALVFALAACGGGAGIYEQVPNYVGGGEQTKDSRFSDDAAYVAISGAEIEDVEGYITMLQVAGYEKGNDLASVYVYQKSDITVTVKYTFNEQLLEIGVERDAN